MSGLDYDHQNATTNNPTENIDELLSGLYYITEQVSPNVRQFSTCILSIFFVVGLLLIIPALLQTAAAFVWAVQVRKETMRNIRPIQGRIPPDPCTGSVEHPATLDVPALSKRDRTLFLYRTLACVASLAVLVFSTLPQLIFVVASPLTDTSIDRRWGWCHVLTFFDNTTRMFATYLIVVPFGLLFWNFIFIEIVPRRNLLTNNVFAVILRSSVPILVLSLLISVTAAYARFEKIENACSASPNGAVYTIYLDFILTRFVPTVCIFVIGVGFLRWLPHNDYGVLYEPGLFFFFLFPSLCCELVLHAFHQAGAIYKLIDTWFSNALMISYAVYHMAFSCTFVVATMRSVITEIREEMRKRKLFFLGDLPPTVDELRILHGSKRRTHLIHGMQKQFSVAFRWKPEFTAEEQRTVAENPKMVIDESLVSETVTQPALQYTYGRSRNNSQNHLSDHCQHTESATASDDAVMHYAILHQSAGLKKQNVGQRGQSPSAAIFSPYPTIHQSSQSGRQK